MEKTKRTPMRELSGEERKSFGQVKRGYTAEEAVKEASRCLSCANPQCRAGCPIANRIPDFMREVRKGGFAAAFRIIAERSCLMDICGTVCPHEDQCEGHCIRNKIDEPVAIGAVERFVGEWQRGQGHPSVKPPACGKRAAAVGSGPASLAYAYELAKEGYAVTVYEERDYLGGVLAWGIPSFRLDPRDLAGHLAELRGLGVEFLTGRMLGRDFTLSQLQERYDSVFLGVGTPLPNRMEIPGAELSGIYQAADFLAQVNLAPPDERGRKAFPDGGKKVLVVGGGNVAMDAARAAIRLRPAPEVTIIYRRSEAEMPASREELDQAREEGIRFLPLHNPAAFHGRDGKVSYAECAVMRLGDPDDSGRRRPVETKEPHLMLECDTVILALGFLAEPLISKLVRTDAQGYPEVSENQETSIAKVYAGGDMATGAKTVVMAMRAGMRAAAATIRSNSPK